MNSAPTQPSAIAGRSKPVPPEAAPGVPAQVVGCEPRPASSLCPQSFYKPRLAVGVEANAGMVGIVSGMLSVSRTVGGEFLLNLSVGPPGGVPENCTYLEFPLASGHALAQGRRYANRYANR